MFVLSVLHGLMGHSVCRGSCFNKWVESLGYSMLELGWFDYLLAGYDDPQLWVYYLQV